MLKKIYSTNGANKIYITEYGIPVRNLWHMLAYAWNDFSITNQIEFGDVEESPTLDALLTSMLVKLIRQRLRVGLGRGYTNAKGLVKAVRGRIKFPESLRRDSFNQGLAFCEFHQYSFNIQKNQIIRSVLHQLIQNKNVLSNELRLLEKSFSAVDLIELSPNLIRKAQLDENDKDYRLMLGICELIMQNLLPLDLLNETRLPTLQRDELTLHLIYEKFIANFYKIKLSRWLVAPQKHLTWHEHSPNQLLPAMKPDLVLEEKSTGRMLVVDTKFTAKSLIKNQWSKTEFDSSHLYQLYAYIKTQEHLSEKHRQAVGILLYPLVNQTLSESIQLQEMTLRIESVDLGLEWNEVEKRLIEIIENDKKV